MFMYPMGPPISLQHESVGVESDSSESKKRKKNKRKRKKDEQSDHGRRENKRRDKGSTYPFVDFCNYPGPDFNAGDAAYQF